MIGAIVSAATSGRNGGGHSGGHSSYGPTKTKTIIIKGKQSVYDHLQIKHCKWLSNRGIMKDLLAYFSMPFPV